MKEHGQYKFRVKAMNDVGQSEPLTSETIIAKDPYSNLPTYSLPSFLLFSHTFE